MLKIEVIRFEAEDVITASVETPVEKPVECTCPTVADKMMENANLGNDASDAVYYSCVDNNHPGCEADTHHCPVRVN